MKFFNSRDKSSFGAYVVPFFAFLLFLPLVDIFTLNHPYLPWWRAHPEQWIYPLQTFCGLGFLVYYWRVYDFSWKMPFWAIGIGIFGFLIWVLPCFIFDLLGGDLGEFGFLRYLGVSSRNEGFNPFIFTGEGVYISIFLRFLRAVCIVPFVEEIFWRGFLMRYIDGADRWESFSLQSSSLKSYFLVTLLFVFVHQPQDFFVAFCYGSLIFYLAKKSSSLGACVIAHMVTNFLLTIYILETKKYGLW